MATPKAPLQKRSTSVFELIWFIKSYFQKQADAGGDYSQNGSENPKAIIKDSEPAFLVKLLALSTAGALTVKYGSLLLDAPFHPSATLALGCIVLPTIMFSLALALKSR